MIALILVGIIKILLTKFRKGNNHKIVTGISMGLGIVLVLFLAISREAYAVTVVFLLLVIKGIILLKSIKAGG